MKEYSFNLTPSYCLYNGVAVLEQKGCEIIFLIEDMENEVLKERLKKAFTNHINYIIKNEECPEVYRRLVNVHFKKAERKEIREQVSVLYTKNEKTELKENDEKVQQKNGENDAAAVLLLDHIISEGVRLKATDIHIEKNQIKYRVLGKLVNGEQLVEERFNELVMRIKLLSGMNVLENKRSQDGQFVYGNEKPVFIRVSCMTLIGKESFSVVLRLLDSSKIPLCIEKLGFNENQVEVIRNLCLEKNGLILICGPTGSGKSTTAASFLLELMKIYENRLKIISLEDPPEYIIPGISQILVDTKNESAFDEALTHVFRQDPDVIFIGEIRNFETAEIAIRASLTGHVVLGTMHCGSAAEGVLRLNDLGIEKVLIACVLKGIINQEFIYSEEKVSLGAEICIPVKNDFSNIKESLSAEEIEKLFLHINNYNTALVRSYQLMKENFRNKRNYRKKEVWNGERADGIHRKSS